MRKLFDFIPHQVRRLPLAIRRISAASADLLVIRATALACASLLLAGAWNFPDWFSQTGTGFDFLIRFPLPIILYESILDSWIGKGRTIGKIFFGVRIRESDDKSLGIGKSFFRSVAKWGPFSIATSLFLNEAGMKAALVPGTMPFVFFSMAYLVAAWFLITILSTKGHLAPYDFIFGTEAATTDKISKTIIPSYKKRLSSSGFLAILSLMVVGVCIQSISSDGLGWDRAYALSLEPEMTGFYLRGSALRLEQRRQGFYETDLVRELTLGVTPRETHTGMEATEFTTFPYTARHVLVVINPSYCIPDFGWMDIGRKDKQPAKVLTSARGLKTILYEYIRLNDSAIRFYGAINVVVSRSVSRAGFMKGLRASYWVGYDKVHRRHFIEERPRDGGMFQGFISTENPFISLFKAVMTVFGFHDFD